MWKNFLAKARQMSDGIVVALIGLLGSGFGSLIGALLSNKVWQYRLEQLEQKVEKHNNLVERTYNLEESAAVTDEKIRVINNRLKDLERFHQPT